MFFYGHQYIYIYIFFFEYMPFGSMNMLFFFFFNFAFLLFCPFSFTFVCPFRPIFMRLLSFSSFVSIFFKNFNGLLKRGSMRFFWGMTLVCMWRKKKIGLKRPFSAKTHNIFCFSTEVNQTQTWSSYLYWAGQVWFWANSDQK